MNVKEIREFIESQKLVGTQDCPCGFPQRQAEFQRALSIYSRLKIDQERLRNQCKSMCLVSIHHGELSKFLTKHNSTNYELRRQKNYLIEIGPCPDCAKAFKPTGRETWNSQPWNGIWLSYDSTGRIIKTSEEMAVK